MKPSAGRLLILNEAAFSGGRIRLSFSENNAEVIEFPAMPDTIELNRAADYNVTSARLLPDGIHVYRQTRHLEIQVNFRLHAMDSYYCANGALTLLEYASKLQALVLPIKGSATDQLRITEVSEPPGGPGGTPAPSGQPPDSEVEQKSVSRDTQQEVRFALGGLAYPPAVCFLQLMDAGEGRPGIQCLGYVSSVRVRFNGPWMKGPHNSYNLPTSADYDFTFVNSPGYTNLMGIRSSRLNADVALENPLLIQGFAQDVYDNLYNTYRLLQKSNVAYNVKGIRQQNRP